MSAGSASSLFAWPGCWPCSRRRPLPPPRRSAGPAFAGPVPRQPNVPFCLKAPAVQCIDQGFASRTATGMARCRWPRCRRSRARSMAGPRPKARQLPPAEHDKLVVGLLLSRRRAEAAVHEFRRQPRRCADPRGADRGHPARQAHPAGDPERPVLDRLGRADGAGRGRGAVVAAAVPTLRVGADDGSGGSGGHDQDRRRAGGRAAGLRGHAADRAAGQLGAVPDPAGGIRCCAARSSSA